jgi:hypothetical protein
MEIFQNDANWTLTGTSTSGANASFNPSQFTADQDMLNITVKFANPATRQQFAAYWAGWTGDQHDLSTSYSDIGLTTLYLAFADYSSGKIDTSISGYICEVPAEGS